MIKKYLIGGATTVGIAFVPFLTIIAISVYALEQYELKLGPGNTMMMSVFFAGMFAVAAFIGFTISFPLLNRLSQNQKTWRYLVMIAVPVVMIYFFAAIGFVEWLFKLIHPRSFAGNIMVGVLAYLLGVVGAVGVAKIKMSPRNEKVIL